MANCAPKGVGPWDHIRLNVYYVRMSVRKRIPPYWLTQPGRHAWHVQGLSDVLHISMANLHSWLRFMRGISYGCSGSDQIRIRVQMTSHRTKAI